MAVVRSHGRPGFEGSGSRVHAPDCGVKVNPPLPHLLLLPGLACDREVWEHQARFFSQITTVHIADYGASDSLEEMARATLGHAPQRFALAGHSMGGRVAFEILRRAPGRVVGLAVLDTGYQRRASGETGERERQERLALVDLARAQGMRVMARRWVQTMLDPARLSNERLVDCIAEMFGRKTPEIFTAQITALLNRPDAAPVLSQIRCRTLVVCGREDTWSPVARHRDIAGRILGSTLAIIANCGHMPPMERPEAVTAAMREWFDNLSSDSE
jgi:pimeloyl-ACP methyl ester carboxylesterase